MKREACSAPSPGHALKNTLSVLQREESGTRLPSWRDGSGVERTGYTSRGPGFNPHYLHGSLQPFFKSRPEHPMPPQASGTQEWYKDNTITYPYTYNFIKI